LGFGLEADDFAVRREGKLSEQADPVVVFRNPFAAGDLPDANPGSALKTCCRPGWE